MFLQKKERHFLGDALEYGLRLITSYRPYHPVALLA